ncbi:MAG TPA: 50S ribosomal protein L9 [Candidatus Limnocylindria bacterium]|nr:50S ribosomal protein L9 [Candidatus Limnocylindria bacterium]
MKVILKRDVKGVGHAGEVKDVKSGHARNFLIPTGAAVTADAAALREWERHRSEREERDRTLHADTEAIAARIRELHLQIAVKAGEKSRLFGSVTNREIADQLAVHGIEVDRHLIHLREPIKTLGEFRAEVRLASGIAAQLSVSVVAV